MGLPRTQTSLSLDENVRAKEGGKPEEETGSGQVRAPHHSTSVKFRVFVELYPRLRLTRYHLALNSVSFLILFPAVSMKICYLVFIKTWKIPWKGLLVIIFYGIFGNSKTGQIFYHLNLSTSWSHTETFFWLVTQFATLETKRELRPKHVPQLFLRSSPVTCRSAIGQFLTVPEVFSKVNSARCPRF